MEEEENSGSRNGEGETDGTVVSVGLCCKDGQVGFPVPLYLYVPPCPFMSRRVPGRKVTRTAGSPL